MASYCKTTLPIKEYFHNDIRKKRLTFSQIHFLENLNVLPGGPCAFFEPWSRCWQYRHYSFRFQYLISFQ